jgi:hypothetical protein
MSQLTKFCRKCLYVKPITDYAKCTACKDGLQAICKICWKLNTKGLPIPQNPNSDNNTNDYNNKIERINGELTVVGKLSPEEEDQLRRDWQCHPYSRPIDKELIKKLWDIKQDEWSKKHKATKGNRGGKGKNGGTGKQQKLLAEQQYINDLNNE